MVVLKKEEIIPKTMDKKEPKIVDFDKVIIQKTNSYGVPSIFFFLSILSINKFLIVKWIF